MLVVGAASSPRRFELLKEVGIDEIVDHKSQKVSDVVSDVDLVLDTVWELPLPDIETGCPTDRYNLRDHHLHRISHA